MSTVDVIKKYMAANNCNVAEFSRRSGIPYTTIDGIFKKGDEKTKLPTLRKLADFMGLTLDELVFDDIQHSTTSVEFSQEEIEMVKRMRALDDAGRSCVMDMLALQEMKMAEKEKSQRQGA